MWPEPLTASSREVDEHTVDVVARDGRGGVVARVRCAYSRRARCGAFGEMRIVDGSGAPRQRVRALVLMVREALRFGATQGIMRAWTEAPERMALMASRMTGLPGTARGRRLLFEGELHALRTHALRVSDAHGNLAGLTQAEEDEIDGAVDVLR